MAAWNPSSGGQSAIFCEVVFPILQSRILYFTEIHRSDAENMPNASSIAGQPGGGIGALPVVESTHSYFVIEEVKESPLLPVPGLRDRRK
jgi:hypothetical protein